MNERENFDRDDLLDRAVEAVLREPAHGEPSPERLAELLARVRHAAEQPNPVTFIERIKSMKPITRIAVAAAALIAFAGLMSWLAPNGGTSAAFAAVAEALNAVESATWKTETVVKGPENKTVTWNATEMFLAPSHQRTEITVNGKKNVSIIDGEKDKLITLDPQAKTAVLVKLKSPSGESPLGRTFQGLREMVAGAKRQGRKSGASGRKDPGRPRGRGLPYPDGGD